ncbi:MAG: site-specific integrase [Candidatus Dormibacteria bacterium]
MLPNNPSNRGHRLGHVVSAGRCWSPAELRQFLVEVSDERDYPLWRLAACTGMRRGELLGLRWSDLDFDRATLVVVRQLVRNGAVVELVSPKTPAGRRTVFIDPVTLAALSAYRASELEARSAVGIGPDLVFCTVKGRPRDPDSVTHQFIARGVRAGLPRIRLHDLRHTHATIALQAQINPKVVQERLGHASVRVTLDTYTHVLQPMHRDAANRIAGLIDGTA